MLYIIEAIGFAGLCYYIAKYESIKWAIITALVLFIVAFTFDPLLYKSGFIYTAHNYMWSLIVNGIPFIGSLSGVGICAKKN